MADEQNPFDSLDEATTPQLSTQANPFDGLDEPSATDETAGKLQHTVAAADQTLPEVTVSARRGGPAPESTWSDVAGALMPTIGAKIETKIAGAKESLGNSREQDAKKKLWQSLILPDAVREAKEQNISLTDHPDVVDIAQHLGIRPDTFTRDWPKYANLTADERQQVQAEQRDRLQSGQAAASEGAQRRQTAAQVTEGAAPNLPSYGIKSLAFQTATMVPDLLAGTAATVATGGIGGAAVMGGLIAPEEYAAARNRGLDDRKASTYATLTTLASSVPEIPVLKIIENAPVAKRLIGGVVGDKLAGTAAGKVVGTSVTQGVTQSVVQALQTGIDEKLFDEQTSLPDALKRIAWAGLTGAVVGAPMGALHAATSGEHSGGKPTTFKEFPYPGETPPAPGAARVEPTLGDLGTIAAGNSPGESPGSAAQVPEPAAEAPGSTPAAAGEPREPLGTIQPLEADELHEALKAVQDKTVSPGQLERLESMGLATRNDVGAARLLPVGRRQLAAGLRERTSATQTSPEKTGNEAGLPPETPPETPKEAVPDVPEAPKPAEVPENGAEQAETAAEPVANRLQTDQDLREGLTAMKGETGWQQMGGQVLRDATTDQVTGRTSWIPNAEWWPGRPKGLTEAQVHQSVDKALAGQPMTKRQKSMVDFMTSVHDERVAMAGVHTELKEAVPELEEQPKPAVDLTLMASRAAEHDSEATMKTIDSWGDDHPDTLARIQGEFEQIIGRGHETRLEAETAGSEQPAAPQRSPAARDLFGEDRSKEQALVDEQRKRDAARSPNRDVSADIGVKGDIFSRNANAQVDFTDQLKQARADTHTEPTEGQREAGNYKKGRVDFAGMEVAIENPKGSTRSGVSPEGKPWERTLEHDYGYFTGSKASDHEGVDVFLTGKPDTGKMFVINQVHPETGKYDEAKIVAGAESAEEAERTYKANYQKGWKGLGSMAEMATPKFKEWLESGQTHKPVRTNVERREDTGQRARVKEMTPEQLRKELLTHELTGIPNRRAYVESEKLPTQVSIDVDSLKAVNDVGGHHAGDELLKAVARVLHEESEHAYHLSGDEFAIQALHPREANAIMERAAERLKNAEIIVAMPDGRTLSLKGLGVSFGVGEDLAKADTALQAHKKQREAEGSRSPRGEAPRGLTFRLGETGGQDRGGEAAAEKEVGPQFSRREQEPRKVPENNYTGPLSRYTPKLYRETNPESLLDYVAESGSMIDLSSAEPHFAETPEMALGQGSNRGVHMEFDTQGLKGRINFNKPMLEHAFLQRAGEYVGSNQNSQADYQKALRAFTIDKEAKSQPWVRMRWRNIVEPTLLRNGWTRTKNEDGSTTWTRPQVMSRRTTATGGLPRDHVEGIVHQTVRDAGLTVGFPHVETHEDTTTLPEHIQRLIKQEGAELTTGAVYDPSSGRIHLIASNNGSEREVRENLWHEAVGHHGLRMAMDGPQYNAVMDGINRDMPERVAASAQRNGLDLSLLDQRRAAAEEVIAYAAGQHLSGQPIDKPVLPYWTRAVRAVKAFFARMTGKPFYDDRAIAGLIQQAHKALESGSRAREQVFEPNGRRKLAQDLFGRKVGPSVTLEQVDRGVLALRNHDEIARRVVSLLPVDVVDKLGGEEGAVEKLLSQQAMIPASLSGEAGTTVARGILDTSRQVFADLRAELLEGRATGRDVDLFPTLKASDLTAREVVSLLAPKALDHVNLPRETLGGHVAGRGAEEATPPDLAERNAEALPTTNAEFLDTPLLAADGTELRTDETTGLGDEGGPARIAEALDWHDKIVAERGASESELSEPASSDQGFPLFARRQQQMALQQPPGSRYERIRRAVEYIAKENPVSKDIRRLIHPTGISAEAGQAARTASEALGVLAHDGQVSQEALEQFSRQVDKMPVADQLQMMDDIEHGRPQVHPELQPVADGMRKMLDEWREKVRGLGVGALDTFIQDYFPHYWANEKEAERMVASIMGRRPLKGPASFLKLRTIPTIKEGMDAGLKPLTVNPLVMTLLKTREMQRFVSGVTLMKRFREDGLAKFLASGLPMPDGWAGINDSIAKVRQWSDQEAGFIERGQYIMPEDAARVINNHVSASVLKNFAPAVVFRVGSSMLNSMQLGFSAFHLGFTTLDASISKNALGIERMIRGNWRGAAAAFAEGMTPAGAVLNVRRGYHLLQAYTNPAGATPEMQKLVRMLEMGGGRAHMDRYYQMSEGVSPFRGVGVRSVVNDVRDALTQPTDRLEKAAKALKDFPAEYATKLLRQMQALGKTHSVVEMPFEVAGRIVRASTSWIMEHLVPMQKLGVFSDLASDHLRNNPLQSQPEREAAMQKIWASVDNRLGEMVYDNLFWNRTFKDMLHFGIRAVGWNAGTVREIGGAPIDVMKMVDKALQGKKVTAEDFGHKIPYVIAMTMTTAMLGAALNYMYTGEGPQELKDYFFPRTGGTTNYGTPQRVSMPSYVKDVYEYSQRPGTTVLNKLNPIFNVLGEMWNNQDFFGNPITDPDATGWEYTKQMAGFVGSEMTPFSLQGRQQMAKTDVEPGIGGKIKQALPYIGITPAPGYVTSPEQMARRDLYERETKYARDMQYKMKKAYEAGDRATGDEYKDRFISAQRHMKETKGEVDQDKAKSAVQRRKAATSMRQQGLPHTADLVASLPLEPDAQARAFFRAHAEPA